MWGGLRAKRFRGKKFLRQHPIFVNADGGETFYVADFYCHEHRLAIELDGGIHDRQRERDALRTAVINEHGITVLRFRNEELEKDFEGVLKRLAAKLSLPPPPTRLNESVKAGRPGRLGHEDREALSSPLFLREGTGESSPEEITEQAIWSELEKIQDPEIPVLSLVEMKIIRRVSIEDGAVSVLLSPTFVGCPALEHMKDEIRSRLRTLGCERVNIELTFSPPWSTDMLEDSTREKLSVFGIAPPPRCGADLAETLARPVACPFCNSQRTRLESSFGATLCKQLFFCDTCRQGFERFKPV